MLASSFGPNYRPETANSEPQVSRFGSASVSDTSNSSTVVSNWANVIPVPMPVPLAPYPAPQPHVPIPPPSPQSQIICIGCRTLLVYPHGAANVRCALCSSVTAVPPGSEMAQLVCGGCRTLLMYVRGASSVQCSCCHTINYAMEGNQMAHVNCGGCNMMLMYAYGAQSVKCALCHFVTTIPAMGFEQMSSARMPVPMQRPSFPPQPSAASVPAGRPQAQTVYVENPMTLDESGKLVSNVAVGVATEKK